MKPLARRKVTRTTGPPIGGFLLLIAAIALSIFVSPLLLLGVAKIFDIDWQRLSDVGQSYTGFSVVLSAVAVAVTALTVRTQARQAQITLEHSVRSNQMELMKFALDNDDLLEAWSPVGEYADKETRRRWRQHFFMTLHLRQMQLAAEVGDFSKLQNKQMLLDEHFFTPHSVRHWEQVRDHWSSQNASRLGRRFIGAVEAAFAESLSSRAVAEDQGRPDSAVETNMPASRTRPDTSEEEE